MSAISRITSMYVDGFRSMTVGRKLWLLIIVKLIVIFGVLKLFFFPDVISDKAGAENRDESSVVRQELVNRK